MHSERVRSISVKMFGLVVFSQIMYRCASTNFIAINIRYRQIFSGGYRTKMKIWSENFSHASGAQKKVFRRGGTENR